MAKGYYRFHNDVYPRQLYIAVGVDEDYVNDAFFSDKGEFALDWDDTDAATFCEVKERSTQDYGSLVVFRSKHEIVPMVMAHEAIHVLDSYMNALDLERAVDGSNEHLSYLTGWIVRCMDEVRTGKAKTVGENET